MDSASTRFHCLTQPGGRLSHFLHDEQEVHAVDPEEAHRDVWNDGDDLAFEAVEKLLQFALIARHFDVKAMDAIFCGHGKLLSICMSLISITCSHTSTLGAATFYNSV
jgi:hypothetical protein